MYYTKQLIEYNENLRVNYGVLQFGSVQNHSLLLGLFHGGKPNHLTSSDKEPISSFLFFQGKVAVASYFKPILILWTLVSIEQDMYYKTVDWI